MPCYQPHHAWLSDTKPRRVLFHMPNKPGYTYTPLPCGKCIGCRTKQSRDWTIRLCHENEQHEEASFITLTYAPEHLPLDGCLQKQHLQNFFKNLRRTIYPKRIRYFACGEYGEDNSRPHYHAIIFGLDISADTEYNYHDLEHDWGKGYTDAGTVTPKSIAYVAGYVQKKLDKETIGDDNIDKETGLCTTKEFVLMSRRPGIGDAWILANHADTYKDDTVLLSYLPNKPPRFYDKKYVKIFGDEALEEIKNKRVLEGRHATQHASDVAVKEKIARAKQIILKKRGYEK